MILHFRITSANKLHQKEASLYVSWSSFAESSIQTFIEHELCARQVLKLKAHKVIPVRSGAQFNSAMS